MNRLNRIKGCLLGGAVGDALGAPTECLDWHTIQTMFGPHGITDFSPIYGSTGSVTGNTQMTLFTAEGLLRAYVCGSSRGICHVPSMIHHALLRWLMTQDYQSAIQVDLDGWLVNEQALWSRRATDDTCVSALKANQQFGFVAENNSKGCGALMRVAPCAFFSNAFEYASGSGRLTHGHPTGYLAGGLFADILQRMIDSQDRLEHAIIESLYSHGSKPGMEEVRAILERVLFYFHEDYPPSPKRIDEFASGRVAEEALAIGIWCALTASSFEQGVITAVNHSGNSNGTGLIAGHLLGVKYGAAAIPARWYERLELRGVIEKMVNDIERVPRDYTGYGGEFDGAIELEYPGS